jgi:hypothetical protein
MVAGRRAHYHAWRGHMHERTRAAGQRGAHLAGPRLPASARRQCTQGPAKQNPVSSGASSSKSVQCSALRARDAPKRARRLLGRSARASSGSCGPASARSASTALPPPRAATCGEAAGRWAGPRTSREWHRRTPALTRRARCLAAHAGCQPLLLPACTHTPPTVTTAHAGVVLLLRPCCPACCLGHAGQQGRRSPPLPGSAHC